MKRNLLFGISLLFCLFSVASTAVQASPYFQIGSYDDWRNALASGGQITPLPGSAFALMVSQESQWPDEYKQARFYTPTLAAREEIAGKPALYMKWGEDGTQGGGGGRIAAAWDYQYRLDPDLNSTTISFSILPPVASTMFSLNLVDGNGNYREWIWHASGNQGDPVPGVWNTLTINPVTGWSNFNTVNGSPFIHNVPGSQFDLGSVTILRFDENMSVFTPNGGALPAGWVWNAWDHVSVTPEPETYAMLLAGLAVVGFMARRRTRIAA
jgi:hypothetical protein